VSELREPLARLARTPSTSMPFLRGGGTTLDDARPPLPRGYVDEVPGAGNVFYRDTGPPPLRNKGTVLLLHGWMVPSDPHWFRTWRLLQVDGWRVVALDARGHGRGTRPMDPFRLVDCAADAAALVRHLECGPVVVVGYSMGGTIAQLLARDNPELLAGAVFCATAAEFQTSLLMRLVWRAMGAFQFGLRLAPQTSWDLAVRMIAQGDRATTGWVVGELRRGAAWDIAEAGREIGRFDSRPWIADVEVPTAVLLTTVDLLVPPARQRHLAELLRAPVIEIESDHLAPGTTPRRFHRGLIEALGQVQRQRERRHLRAVDARSA
jgi:3-oxoadipate enol-lactonase